jgi:hypothetical protein
MRMALGLMMTAMLMGSALAQGLPPMSFPMGGDKQLTDEEKAKNAERERAYKAAIGKIPDQKAADPWGNVRSSEPQSNKTSTTPKRTTETGSQAGSK